MLAKLQVGKIGEDIAERFLVKHGHVIISRNYRVKGGEIDIISRKNNKLYFVEVKSVSREMFSRETRDEYRPEDNIHLSKLKRLNLAINLYLETNSMQDEDWQIAIVTVRIDQNSKSAKVEFFDDFAW